MIKKLLGTRISAYRRARRFSQEKLAELCEYSADFIGLVERGVNAPTVEGCERIALALGVKVVDLFDFDAPLPPPPEKTKPQAAVKRPRGRPRLDGTKAER